MAGPVLNVAEKNDAAKSIAAVLSNGNSQRHEGLSPYNKIYTFRCELDGGEVDMRMTSVSGHLLGHEFPKEFSSWDTVPFDTLFDAPVEIKCPDNNRPIFNTLEREARRAAQLIIWTDCDREGEAIGFEVMGVCLRVNPRLRVRRAKFSEITAAGIWRALRTLGLPDARLNDAVTCRSELDLRTGAAFTRLQTIRLRGRVPALQPKTIVSYGSCQFPTLGFVVERYKANRGFVPEDFWRIRVTHRKADITTEFAWHRLRLFVRVAVEALLAMCQAAAVAVVSAVRERPKSRWRPLPLDTVELEKLGVRKLRLTAKQTLDAAEKLYQKGFLSYPRTETNQFPVDLDLRPLVEAQTPDAAWGPFAADVLQRGLDPRRGTKSDQAHPPIHPLKGGPVGGSDAEQRVFALVTRHFLACLSRDARGSETTVDIGLGGEGFTATGLVVLDRGYLDVYPYDAWNGKVIGNYRPGETFVPDSIVIADGRTTAPPLLTEADLITLMDKHGIGTDATHAQHIETIQTRSYAGLTQEGRFMPGFLGLGLVDGYEEMGYRMARPDLRSEFEADLKAICEGTKRKADILPAYIRKYRDIFGAAEDRFATVVAALRGYFGAAPAQPPQPPPPPPAAPNRGRGRGAARGRGVRGARARRAPRVRLSAVLGRPLERPVDEAAMTHMLKELLL